MFQCPHCKKLSKEKFVTFEPSPKEQKEFFEVWLHEFKEERKRVKQVLSNGVMKKFLSFYLVYSDTDRGQQVMLSHVLKVFSSKEISVDGFSLMIFDKPGPRRYGMVKTEFYGRNLTVEEKIFKLSGKVLDPTTGFYVDPTPEGESKA